MGQVANYNGLSPFFTAIKLTSKKQHMISRPLLRNRANFSDIYLETISFLFCRCQLSAGLEKCAELFRSKASDDGNLIFKNNLPKGMASFFTDNITRVSSKSGRKLTKNLKQKFA